LLESMYTARVTANLSITPWEARITGLMVIVAMEEAAAVEETTTQMIEVMEEVEVVSRTTLTTITATVEEEVTITRAATEPTAAPTLHPGGMINLSWFSGIAISSSQTHITPKYGIIRPNACSVT